MTVQKEKLRIDADPKRRLHSRRVNLFLLPASNLLTHSIDTHSSVVVKSCKDKVKKKCIFRFLNANKNILTVSPLRKIAPQTTASSNRDANTHGSQRTRTRIFFSFFYFFFLIILPCKEIYVVYFCTHHRQHITG